jgi:hypothetical protein
VTSIVSPASSLVTVRMWGVASHVDVMAAEADGADAANAAAASSTTEGVRIARPYGALTFQGKPG